MQPQARHELQTVPGIMQTLGLLTLTHAELMETADHALAENPMLERADGHPCLGCGRHIVSGYCPRCRAERGTSLPGQFAGQDREQGMDPFQTLEVLARLEVRPKGRRALPVVVAHLTSRGLLDEDPQDIAASHGLQPEEVAEALRALKAAGPAGLGERSITELLAVQAEDLVSRALAPDWLPLMIRKHLEDLGSGDVQRIAIDSQLSPNEVAQGVELIRTKLRPFALAPEAERNDASPADIFLYRNSDGTLEVEVPASSWFGLRVTEREPGLNLDRDSREWLERYQGQARLLLRQLDTRAEILLRITAYAANRQSGYLEHGPRAHRDLTRTNVAFELGVHPSTVSRAVQGKMLRLPSGRVVELACLFGRGIADRWLLERLLGLDPGLSDQQLCDQMSRQGITLARRTITKYRHTLHTHPASSASV